MMHRRDYRLIDLMEGDTVNAYLDALARNRLTLIMSLPKNDPELCQAAFEAGADIVKVHINVEHRASGVHFGRLAEEHTALREIFEVAQGRIGLVPGGSLDSVMLDIEAALQLPVAFFSLYSHHVPAFLTCGSIPLMAACDSTFTLQEIEGMRQCGASVVEASIVPGSEYGTVLSMRDLLQYRSIVYASGLPVVVPTQRAIQPRDVPALIRTGVRGLMIGAVVTGKTKASIETSIARFREAIEEGKKC